MFDTPLKIAVFNIRRNYLLLAFYLLAALPLWAQSSFDTSYFTGLNYDQIEDVFKGEKNNGDVLREISVFYLNKAKRENNSEHLCRGYFLVAQVAKDPHYALTLIDSAISLAHNLQIHDNEADALLEKGIILSRMERFPESLSCYNKAITISTQYNLEYIKHYTIFCKALVYQKQDMLDHAMSHYQIAKNWFSITKNTERYSFECCNIYRCLAGCYNQMKDYDSAIEIGKEGMLLSQKYNTGQKESFRKLYAASMTLDGRGSEVLIDLYELREYYDEDHRSYPFISNTLMHIYWELDSLKLAKYFADEVLQLYSKYDKGIAYAIESYDFLIQYFEDKRETQELVKALMAKSKLDSILSSRNAQLKVALAMDTIQDNVYLMAPIKVGSYSFTHRALWILLGISFPVLLHFLLKKRNSLMLRFIGIKQDSSPLDNKLESPAKSKANSSTMLILAKRLQEFEDEKTYLYNSYSLSELATKLNTNPKYLSELINTQKGCNFTSYLRRLRMLEVRKEIELNVEKYGCFSIEGIANHFGYRNVSTFSRDFKQVHEITPSNFLISIKT